jgi:hypothetical protein
MRAAVELNADKVGLLLTLGADPNIENMPGGDTALDLVIAQIEKSSTWTNGDQSAKTIAVLEALTKGEKSTIKRVTLDRFSEQKSGKDNPTICSPEWIRPRQAASFCKALAPQIAQLQSLALRAEFHGDCPL